MGFINHLITGGPHIASLKYCCFGQNDWIFAAEKSPHAAFLASVFTWETPICHCNAATASNDNHINSDIIDLNRYRIHELNCGLIIQDVSPLSVNANAHNSHRFDFAIRFKSLPTSKFCFTQFEVEQKDFSNWSDLPFECRETVDEPRLYPSGPTPDGIKFRHGPFLIRKTKTQCNPGTWC